MNPMNNAVFVDAGTTNTRVWLMRGEEVLAHAAGGKEVNFVRMRPGDRVLVEVSPHDRRRGRIVKLLRKT